MSNRKIFIKKYVCNASFFTCKTTTEYCLSFMRGLLGTFVCIFLIIFIFYNTSIFAEVDTDQWQDSNLTYKDLIDQGFEVKAYDINTITTDVGLILVFFVTVLQKEKEVYECQEYQTFDGNMKTLDMSVVCRELTQPYKRGVDT